MTDTDAPTPSRWARWLATGRSTMVVAAVWSVFDALLHVAIDMIEPPRIGGNLAVVAAAVIVHLIPWPRLSALVVGLAGGVVVGLNAAFFANEEEILLPTLVFIGVALGLSAWAMWRFVRQSDEGRESVRARTVVRWGLSALGIVAIIGAGVLSYFLAVLDAVDRQLYGDQLVAADYWDDELRILSAGFGFDNIIGVPGVDVDSVRAAGGAFVAAPDCVDPEGPIMSTSTPDSIGRGFRGFADFDDGLPIVVTWPVLTSNIHPEDFLFTLNTGEQVFPNAAGMVPNWELNERNTIVVFGDLGNRLSADDPDAVFPVKLEIVDDGTPIEFLGPEGVQSGVGLTWETDATPYDSGPVLVGAKLNHVGDEPEGEGGVPTLDEPVGPNDEFALYGGGDFRLRTLTSGGFSPDGLTGVTPDQYEDFFRIHATAEDGSTVLLSDVDVDYEVAGGTLRVVGLSDLGQPAGDGVHYDDCYDEDADNYIDIILVGDEAAARSVTHIEIPAEGDYLPFYNPGGPGPEPFPDVVYTAPGPPDLEPVTLALDDPMRVTNEDQ